MKNNFEESDDDRMRRRLAEQLEEVLERGSQLMEADEVEAAMLEGVIAEALGILVYHEPP